MPAPCAGIFLHANYSPFDGRYGADGGPIHATCTPDCRPIRKAPAQPNATPPASDGARIEAARTRSSTRATVTTIMPTLCVGGGAGWTLRAPPQSENPTGLASPIIVSGGAIPPWGGGGVKSSNGKKHKPPKKKANPSKPASSP